MHRTSAIVSGVLWLLGVVTALVSSNLAGTMLDAPMDSAAVASHHTQLLVAVLFQFLSAVVSAGIAIALYPAIREHDYVVLYRSKLIPRWLSTSGLVAIVPLVLEQPRVTV
jgi:hypothetical protein